MIRLLQFFTLLTILQIGCSLGVTECRSLAYVCRQDAECLDDQVFFIKCLKRVLNSETDSGLFHHKIQSSDYFLQQPHKLNYPFKNFPNKKIGSAADSVFDSLHQEQNQFQNPKQTPYLQDIYNLYNKQSIRDSLRILQDQRSEDLLLKKRNDQENGFLVLNDQEIKTKKRNLLKSTFDLVKTLIDKRKDYNVHIISDASDTLTLRETEKHSDINENLHSSATLTEKKKVSSFEPAYIPEKDQDFGTNSIDLSTELGNREEVAVPELIDKSEIDVQDIQRNQKALLVKTLNSISTADANKLGEQLQNILWKIKPSDHQIFHLLSVNNNTTLYHMVTDPKWFESVDDETAVSEKLKKNLKLREQIKKSTGITIVAADTTDTPIQSTPARLESVEEPKDWDKLTVFTAVISACILVFVIAVFFFCYLKRRNKDSSPVAFKKQEAVQDYQELCRTQMSVKNSRPEEDEPDTNKDGAMKGVWGDNSFPHNMDITTGHVILAYMEDHLQNENRLNKEWQALCDYKADENDSTVGTDPKNISKNRFQDVLPYNKTRVKLRETSNAFHSDYINANFITDADPRNPTYIATQGPLDNTVADFWQMIWENGIVVIVNLTKLSDMGLPQCHRYWPEDGSEIYHIYEVNLISEHIWCDDYLVRSLYLKNLQTGETRTITQFHYLSWPDLCTPDSPKSLLEFRRKVNKCYRGHACPIIVHCNNGIGRTGTYILLDMVLNKIVKGTKEIDIAATLEHLRDQRADMVKTKGQFEFALTALAEEVTAILSAVPR